MLQSCRKPLTSLSLILRPAKATIEPYSIVGTRAEVIALRTGFIVPAETMSLELGLMKNAMSL
jgi:hypothetical protein